MVESGAVAARATLGSRLRMWFVIHIEEAQRSWQDIWRAPFSSLMTLLVVGIALALPAVLTVALKNGSNVAGQIQSNTQVTLYLRQGTSDATARQIAGRLRADPLIQSLQYLSQEQALAEFREHSGYGAAIDNLEQNPLPAVIILQPTLAGNDPAVAESLLGRMRLMPEVEQAQLDLDWLRKLQALVQLGQRAVMVLSLLLGLAVVLIVGNTIRLAIQNRRAEIEVFKLVGATDAFIRRPFMYSGIWFGAVGGALAWAMIAAALWWLDEPVRTLASLYQSGFRIEGLNLEEGGRLLAFGALLGLAGSLISVNRHLKEIEPR